MEINKTKISGWKEYLNYICEGYNKPMIKYKDINVSINTKNRDEEISSHVEDRLKERSKIKYAEFISLIKKLIDKLIKKDKDSDTYTAILRKSKIKIVFKYNKDRNDVFIVTILDDNMKPKNKDSIFFMEDVFKELKIDLKNNEYLLFEDTEHEHKYIEFYNKNNMKYVDGIEIIEIDL